MKNRPVISTFFALVILSSCNQNAGSRLHATVLMRDGTSVSGTAISTSRSEIQVLGDDKIKRTIPMGQVRSIEYDDTPSTTSADNTPPPAGTPIAASAPPARELPHREHYHPVESAITTKTFVLPPGTEISVRNEETIDSGKAADGQTFPAEVTEMCSTPMETW